MVRISTFRACYRNSIKLLASLCAVAHLALLGHMVLVRHATCPEHGELVHAGQGTDAPHGASAAIATDSTHADHASNEPHDVQADRVGVGVGESDADSHCDVLGHLREKATPSVSSATLLEQLEIAASVASAPPRAASNEPARYRIAPKTSPPRA